MNFDDLLKHILGGPQSSPTISVIGKKSCGSPPEISNTPSPFKAYKKSVARHIIKSDNISKSSAEVKQILNSANLEQVETFLRQMGYCDQGILKTYRMFVSQEPYDQQKH